MDDNWVPLQNTPNLEETLDDYAAYDGPKVGWCLLCNSPIQSDADFIPQTNTHNCAQGRRLHEQGR